MIDHKALTRIAKVVAAEMKKHQVSSVLARALDPLDAEPEHVFDIVELMAKEGLKKKPNDDLIAAYAYMLAHGLDMLSQGAERGDGASIAHVENLRSLLLDAGRAGAVTPAVLMIILHQFASVKLDIGDRLREMMEQGIELDPVVAHEDVRSHLAGIAKELANDPFAIHACLHEGFEALPEQAMSDLAIMALNEGPAAIREAALGFVLSSSKDTRAKMIEHLARGAPNGLISTTMLRRMIAIRNWLPEPERAGLDAVIETARAKGVICAATGKADVIEILASGIDGSGALTVLAIVKDGRKKALAGVLMKQGMGIRDAWVRRGLSTADLRELVQYVGNEVGLAPSSPDYLATILRQCLAINIELGIPPPFDVLDVAEMCGLAEINPVSMSVEALVDKCLAEVDPASLSPVILAVTLHMSNEWLEVHPILGSWFEENVSKIVGGNRGAHKKQIASLLAGPLQARRRRWAELCAWTAQSLKHQDDPDWQAFTIVARELLGTRPLDQIGLMKAIAMTTLETIEMEALPGLVGAGATMPPGFVHQA